MTPPTWPTQDWKASVNADPVVPFSEELRPESVSKVSRIGVQGRTSPERDEVDGVEHRPQHAGNIDADFIVENGKQDKEKQHRAHNAGHDICRPRHIRALEEPS